MPIGYCAGTQWNSAIYVRIQCGHAVAKDGIYKCALCSCTCTYVPLLTQSGSWPSFAHGVEKPHLISSLSPSGQSVTEEFMVHNKVDGVIKVKQTVQSNLQCFLSHCGCT